MAERKEGVTGSALIGSRDNRNHGGSDASMLHLASLLEHKGMKKARRVTPTRHGLLLCVHLQRLWNVYLRILTELHDRLFLSI